MNRYDLNSSNENSHIVKNLMFDFKTQNSATSIGNPDEVKTKIAQVLLPVIEQVLEDVDLPDSKLNVTDLTIELRRFPVPVSWPAVKQELKFQLQKGLSNHNKTLSFSSVNLPRKTEPLRPNSDLIQVDNSSDNFDHFVTRWANTVHALGQISTIDQKSNYKIILLRLLVENPAHLIEICKPQFADVLENFVSVLEKDFPQDLTIERFHNQNIDVDKIHERLTESLKIHIQKFVDFERNESRRNGRGDYENRRRYQREFVLGPVYASEEAQLPQTQTSAMGNTIVPSIQNRLINSIKPSEHMLSNSNITSDYELESNTEFEQHRQAALSDFWLNYILISSETTRQIFRKQPASFDLNPSASTRVIRSPVRNPQGHDASLLFTDRNGPDFLFFPSEKMTDHRMQLRDPGPTTSYSKVRKPGKLIATTSNKDNSITSVEHGSDSFITTVTNPYFFTGIGAINHTEYKYPYSNYELRTVGHNALGPSQVEPSALMIHGHISSNNIAMGTNLFNYGRSDSSEIKNASFFEIKSKTSVSINAQMKGRYDANADTKKIPSPFSADRHANSKINSGKIELRGVPNFSTIEKSADTELKQTRTDLFNTAQQLPSTAKNLSQSESNGDIFDYHSEIADRAIQTKFSEIDFTTIVSHQSPHIEATDPEANSPDRNYTNFKIMSIKALFFASDLPADQNLAFSSMPAICSNLISVSNNNELDSLAISNQIISVVIPPQRMQLRRNFGRKDRAHNDRAHKDMAHKDVSLKSKNSSLQGLSAVIESTRLYNPIHQQKAIVDAYPVPDIFKTAASYTLKLPSFGNKLTIDTLSDDSIISDLKKVKYGAESRQIFVDLPDQLNEIPISQTLPDVTDTNRHGYRTNPPSPDIYEASRVLRQIWAKSPKLLEEALKSCSVGELISILTALLLNDKNDHQEIELTAVQNAVLASAHPNALAGEAIVNTVAGRSIDIDEISKKYRSENQPSALPEKLEADQSLDIEFDKFSNESAENIEDKFRVHDIINLITGLHDLPNTNQSEANHPSSLIAIFKDPVQRKTHIANYIEVTTHTQREKHLSSISPQFFRTEFVLLKRLHNYLAEVDPVLYANPIDFWNIAFDRLLEDLPHGDGGTSLTEQVITHYAKEPNKIKILAHSLLTRLQAQPYDPNDNMLLNLAHELRTVLSKKEDRQNQNKTQSLQLTQTAGLILLWPYLPKLFNYLELLGKRNFFGIDEKIKAVNVLRYITHGNTGHPHAYHSLERLLCNIPRWYALPAPEPITESEQKIVDEMLGAVVLHWSALGGTSIDGLRETFLRRDGEIQTSLDTITLTVMSKAYDMLIDRLPWSLNHIKLSWMKHQIKVSWRN